MAVCPATGALLYPESDIKVFSLIGIPSFRDRWGLKYETFIPDVTAGTCRRTWNQTLLETPASPSVGTAGILGIKVFMDDAFFIFQRWKVTKSQNFRKRLYDGLQNLLGKKKKTVKRITVFLNLFFWHFDNAPIIIFFIVVTIKSYCKIREFVTFNQRITWQNICCGCLFFEITICVYE